MIEDKKKEEEKTEDIIKLKPDQKKIFLKTVNKKGFILEDRTWKVLINTEEIKRIDRNVVIEYPEANDRVEVDFIFQFENYHLIIECKRTDFTWFFPKSIGRSELLSLIYDSDKGVKVSIRGNSIFRVAWYDIDMAMKGDRIFDVTNKWGGLAKTSRQEIHQYIRQVLKETEAYISTEEYLGIRKSPPNDFIYPVIVTNAKLYSLDYSKDDINSDGDLTNYSSIKKIGFVAYNFPEIVRWDERGNQVVSNTSEPQDHVKTVFIVNINHLKEFLRIISYQS
ncbi:MAG: hypothetical protein ABIB47_05105 [Candidatus Woesearchaeota archaeon]